MQASETQRAEASPVIGANAAFNNKTKEELEMHMFKKCGFSPNPFTLSLCGFGNFILTVGLAEDKKEQKRGTWGGGAHRFCKVLLDVFIHFYVHFISSHVNVWGGAKMLWS